MLNWIVGGIGRMLPQPVVIQVSESFAAFHPQLWWWTVLTHVSLMQDVHTDQVQKSKCNTPLQAGLETEPGVKMVLLCVHCQATRSSVWFN